MTNAQIRHLRALISAGLLDFGCQKTLGNEEVFGNELGFLSATPTRPRMDVSGDGGTASWLKIRRVQLHRVQLRCVLNQTKVREAERAAP
jgi:hypothetical protein